MTPEAARIVIGTAVIAATPAVVWLTYALLGSKGYLISLIVGALFLSIMWILTWRVGNSWTPGYWTRTARAFLIAAFAGWSVGTVMNCAGAELRIGMFTVFIVSGFAWIVLTSIFWSQAGPNDFRTAAKSPPVERPEA